MHKQAGFTLIELVVVIVILGILGAFALPKFVDLQGDARNATLHGLKGSLHGAASLAHAKSLTTGNSTSITVEGQAVVLEDGYPAASSDGIIKMLQDLSGFDMNSTGSNPASMTFWPDGVSTNADCQVTYQEANGTTGDAPNITITATDCS